MLSRKSVEFIIEQQLVEVGWDMGNISQVIKNVAVIPKDRDIKLNYLLFDQYEKPIACIIVNEGIKLNVEYKKKLLSCAEKLNILYIFLVLGNEIYFWDFQNDDARIISSFYSQKDLERLILIGERERHGFSLAFKIPEMPHMIQKVHEEILDEFNGVIIQGKKEFIVHLTTGTGKTVLTTAMINDLIKNGHAMKILIVASRIDEAKQIQHYLMDHSINSLIVRSWIGKEDFEKNFNEVHLGVGVFISTIHTITNRDFQYSSGLFDTVFIYSGIQLQNISSLRKNLGLDALYINFTSVPFNTEAGGEKLDYSFDIKQAIEAKILAPFEVVKVNIKSSDYNEKGKKALLHLNAMRYIQYNLINNVEHDYNTKTIIVASNIEEAQWIVKYLNDSNKKNNVEYARLVTSNLKSEYLFENINRFREGLYPQILVSVNLVGMGLKFNNVANVVLLNKFNNPIFLYNMISNVLLKSNKEKKPVKIYDFYENEKIIDLFSNNMIEHRTSKSSISKIIQKNVKDLNDQSSFIEIVEKGIAKRVSRLEFIEMWELFVWENLKKNSIIEHTESVIEDIIIELIQNRKLYYFNEFNLCRAYEVYDKILSDFIWHALNNNEKDRENRWNRIFDVWIRNKKLTEMQFTYIIFLKNIGINSGEITLKLLDSKETRMSINLVGLGRKLFGHEELEQIIKELNEGVFKVF
ncbi:hypothetical protein AYK81_28830 [Bacillus thuringiensis]|nr:hypothetical protein AYK81_28830 [Bacillus thuringiensis]